MTYLSKKDEELLEKMMNEVSTNEVTKTMDVLTTEIGPRPSGSPEEEAAVQYLKGVLERYDVKTKVLRWPSYCVIPKIAQLKVISPLEMNIQCSPFRQNVTSPPEGVEGELVYIGPEDIGLKDCKEKIVLAETYVPGDRKGIRRSAFLTLEKMGAKAVIVISQDEFMPTLIHQRADFSVSGNPTPDNFHLIHKIPAVVQVTHTDGQKLKRLVDNGPTRVWLKSEVDAGWKTLPLLTAEIEAGKKTDKFIMIDGHMDTPPFSPGVTDNSSGNAAIVELARVFNKYKDRLKRNIRIVFWTSHEIGRYGGSTWYNDNFWHDLRYDCIMNLGIDSPGAFGATKWRNVSANELADLAVKCVKDVVGVDVGVGSYIGGRGGDGSFWGTGFPKCGIGSGLPEDMRDPVVSASGGGWWWHTPWATIDRYDIDILVKTVKTHIKFLFTILNSPVLPMSFGKAIDAHIKILEGVQAEIEKVRAYFNLYPVIERMKELRAESDALDNLVNETMEKFEKSTNKEAFEPIFKRLNHCFMWVGRHINIVSHWNAKKTGQISMEEFGSKPFPSLLGGKGVLGVLDLTKMALPYYGPKPDFNMLKTKLLRERNWIEDGYYLSIQEIKKTVRRATDLMKNI